MREALQKSAPAIGKVAVVCAIIVIIGVAGLSVVAARDQLSGDQAAQLGAAGPSGLVVLGASISVPSDSGNGTLTILVRNQNAPGDAVTGITFSDDNPSPISNINSLALLYQGRPVNPTNPLPVGDTACNSMNIENVTAGDAYSVEIDATYQDGSGHTQIISMTAQMGEDTCASISAIETTTQTTSSCDATVPLTLSQIGPVTSTNYGASTDYPSLILTWWNCSDQTFKFAVIASPLTVVLDTNGTTTTVTGTLDTTFPNSTYISAPDSGIGLEFPIVLSPPLGPGTTIQHVNGTVTAINSVTGRPISMQIVVNT